MMDTIGDIEKEKKNARKRERKEEKRKLERKKELKNNTSHSSNKLTPVKRIFTGVKAFKVYTPFGGLFDEGLPSAR